MHDDMSRLFSGHPLPMLACAAETGEILAANDAAKATYGYTAEEFAQLAFADLVQPAEDQLLHLTGAAQAHRNKQGDTLIVDVYSQEIPDLEPRVSVMTVQDASERYNVEQALRRQIAFAEQLFDNSPDAMVHLDADDCVVRCNGSFEELFGWKTE
ncbi:MAG: PAS domain-containing protein, partial [Gammaproteobacteria bacterium]|nr:PAS domain-containing protein [Gammaproteobacteria bacterium]